MNRDEQLGMTLAELDHQPSFCLVADVLGFSELILSLDEDLQEERVASWVSVVTQASRSSRLSQISLFSDTIFVIVEPTVDGLASLLSFSQELLNRAIAQGFAVRGGIDVGAVSTSEDLIYGRAVIRAYRLCEAQDWVGVSCAYSFPALDSLWSLDLVCSYAVPLHSGESDLRPCSVWTVPTTAALRERLAYLAPWHERKLDDRTVRKIRNTEAFARYLQTARSQGWPADQYAG